MQGHNSQFHPVPHSIPTPHLMPNTHPFWSLRGGVRLRTGCFCRAELSSASSCSAGWSEFSVEHTRVDVWGQLGARNWTSGKRTMGTLVHCRCKCKMVQLLGKTVWWFLTQLNVELPYDSASPHQSVYPKYLKTETQNKFLYVRIHDSILHNSQDKCLATTQIPIKGRMDKQNAL